MPLTQEKPKSIDHPLLSVRDLCVTFQSRKRIVHAVNDISFIIAPGEVLGLVGESGSGKSVTAHSILQILPPSAQFHLTGSILFGGKELTHLSKRELLDIRGGKISMIFQEPMNSLNPLHTIGRQICESLIIHKKLSRKAAESRALDLLKKVGLPDPKHRIHAFPHQLSGGQCQRVMIAMALANEPKLLIADEPTTALDVTIQAQILHLLKDLQQELNMAMLIISHDLNLVKNIADSVCVMHQGQILERNTTDQLFNAPQHPYTKALINAEPIYHEPTPTKTSDVLLEARQLKVWFPIQKGLFKRTQDYVKAVNQVSIQVESGETLGIVGESGSGKTTLGMALLRLIQSSGHIYFERDPLQALSQKLLRPYRKSMQIVFQNPFASLNPRLSVESIIEEGLIVHNIGKSALEREKLVIEILKEVGLDPEARQHYPHEFSGGQRQRIAIARALILKPKLMILDEPTSALDHLVQQQILELLKRLQVSHNLTYIFISHDLSVVRSISHRVLVMKQGEIIESASAEHIFNTPSHAYTKSLVKAAFEY